MGTIILETFVSIKKHRMPRSLIPGVLSLFLLLACQVGAPVATTIPAYTASATVIPTATLPPSTNTPTATETLVATATLEAAPFVSNPCKLREFASRGDIGLGFPGYPSRSESIGTLKAAVLFVDFPDARASQTPEQVFSVISPGASDFFRAVSYGRLDLQLEPYFAWLQLVAPSTYYGDSVKEFDRHRFFIQEAVSLADPEVDFSEAQAIYIISNPEARGVQTGPAFTGSPDFGGISADGQIFYNAVTSGADLTGWGFLWLNHEVGHNLGLVDLYAYQGADQHRFVGDFSLMGNVSGTAPEYFAYERWLLGWLDDDQIVCQETKDETTTLTALEEAGGLKAVMVRLNRTSILVVESRRKLGYDSNLVKPGALVYTVNSAIASGEGPINVFPNNDFQRLYSPLATGESVTVENVTVTVIDSTAEGDTVQVTVTD